ncbi:flavin reductase family protein [Actinomadura sp. DC4]|uniref:flavin reductase family protein n=1 Tax=Actinomadura sp. DC4 TaxID=3055069 RepID=UPI0025B0F9E6|nr:flavin reductase family protein [Actinomadura sp. DC4]MDN3356903.1 flavin reductase family protein [Actinomadura sp. DC4]
MGEVGPQDFTDAVATFGTGVVVVTVRDGRDDIGTTLTAFSSVSLEPPLVLVAVAAESYLTEVLRRCERFAVTVLSAEQRVIAGRFASAGRPSARLLVAGVPHHRGTLSDALIVDDGRAALECETRQHFPAGDHEIFLAEVRSVDYVALKRSPLIRVDHRYR